VKTFKDLKDEITRIAKIDVKGFDSDWVLRKFARDQALANIELIKPYTDKYELIVMFLVTGKNADVAYAASATEIAGISADDDAAMYAAAATYAATATYTATHAAMYATHAAVATYATATADYTKAIASLKSLANEYLALLPKEGE